jgi:hypothetical protein
MADPTVGVFDMNSFTATTRVADYFNEDLQVPIDRSVAPSQETFSVDDKESGKRNATIDHQGITIKGADINGPGFIKGGDVAPGQEQIVVHSGDQVILIDKSQRIRIKHDRQTEVGKNEEYANKQNYDHQVLGDYNNRHYKWSTEVCDKRAEHTYNDILKQKIHKGETVTRLYDQTVIIKGNEYVNRTGDRTHTMSGWDIAGVFGGRLTGVSLLDVKGVPVDLGATLAKDSHTILDAKEALVRVDLAAVKPETHLVNIRPIALLLRVGALCLKAASNIGPPRW